MAGFFFEIARECISRPLGSSKWGDQPLQLWLAVVGAVGLLITVPAVLVLCPLAIRWSLVSGEFMCFYWGWFWITEKTPTKHRPWNKHPLCFCVFFLPECFSSGFRYQFALDIQRYLLGIHCWGRERKKINNTMGNEDLVAYMVRKQRAQQAQQAFEAGCLRNGWWGDHSWVGSSKTMAKFV